MPIYFTLQGGEISVIPELTKEIAKISDYYYPQVFRKSVTTNGDSSIEFYESLKLYGITHITFSLHKPNRKSSINKNRE